MQTSPLTTESVPKLFFRYLVPSICGTMVTSIYILADTIIIGKGIGIDAMAALNIILPTFNLFFGTGLLFGVGGSVLMSISRGRKDPKLGQTFFTLSLLLNGIFCLLYMILFLLFTEPIARFLGATEITLPFVMQYMPYILWGMCAFMFSTFLQTFIRNDGAPKLSMIAVITGGVLNVVLDIIFVFPLQMGMAGASIASVIGSAVTVCILLTHFRSANNGLRLRWAGISFKKVTTIFQSGFTSFLVDMSAGVVTFVFNIQLLRYIGDIGVSVYGIIANTSIVVFCLCNGISQAAQPLVSTNYGAGLKARTEHVKKLGLKTALMICALPALLGLFFPKIFVYIFLNPNEQVLQLAPSAIRMYFTAFFVTGINMFVIAYFQATVKSGKALFLCLLRGCVLSTLFVNILPLFVGVPGIWLAVPCAELITLFFALFFLHSSQKKELAQT